MTVASRLGVGFTYGCALVLAPAAAYEALVALGAIDLGRVPGAGPPGEEYVLLAAVVALLVAAVAAPLVDSRRSAVPILALLATATAFVVARFFTFDPYYLPTLRRMSEGGAIPPVWVAGFVVAAIGAALLTRTRVGVVVTPLVLLVAAFTAVVMGLN